MSDLRRPTPDLPLIVEERPPTASERASGWLRGRRILLAALLALAEVIVYVIQRPSLTLATVLAILVGVAAAWGVIRLKPGLARDALLIVAIAQALVVLLPLAIGISLVVALLLAVVLLVGLVVLAFRLKV